MRILALFISENMERIKNQIQFEKNIAILGFSKFQIP